MEIESSSSESYRLNPQDRIIQRLESLGVPAENLEQLQPGLVAYVKNNKSQMGELVSALLPTNEEAMEVITEQEIESPKSTGSSSVNVKDLFQESMDWIQWLMFDGEPSIALEQLADTGQRGVCSAVWGNNDIAYRCRTCEHDPTCAICVPCFQNGNHKDHDYSIIHTGGGCCDCGDVTAWKREGFCSKHKGAEQIQPLPEEFANSLGPVLDILLSCWRKRLLVPESISGNSPRGDDHATELKTVTNELTSAVVEMLLKFCKHSESLLSFISWRISSSAGLLDILVRAERFRITEENIKKIHELLLKLLGEPQFKYEFAKVFLSYYPTVVNEAIRETSDTVFNKYPLVSTFSVQIFTVPTLTPRLVKEMNLLSMLLGCLGDIFVSCAGEDGKLQVMKWENLSETTIRVVEDIRFVMSHAVLPRYVTHGRRDILRTWMKLLSFLQGTNPQKRETGIHVEEENENMHLPFALGHSIANIHSLLVGGAFSMSSTEDAEDAFFNIHRKDFEDQDSQRHAKVGRLSQESSVCSMTGRSPLEHASRVPEVKDDSFPVSSSVICLTFECLRAIENWLIVDNTSGPLLHLLCPKISSTPGNNFSVLKKTLSKFRRGRGILKTQSPSSNDVRHSTSAEGDNKQHSYPSLNSRTTLDYGQSSGQEAACLGSHDDSMLEGDNASELEALRLLSLSDWPDIVYKVSLQDISLHIPLHRLLSMVLQRALGECYGASSANLSSSVHYDFFGHILGGYHPQGFSAFIMEHALRIRVFCAQVHAGMWRRNGDAAILSCEWYRSVHWSEQGLELDLFLLQCCAALAPADLYISRILERFELSNYLSFNLERPSEYEPALVQEMLTLIIQIVKERRFCGLTSSACLQRELVYRLSIGDATHSQLVKSLPRDLSKIDKFQEVLDKIAMYSNPSGMNQGMYKLRLPYWKELDLYHPRWNSRDLQVAEERYMRFCHASALTTQLPGWSKIYPPLGRIAEVATCRTVLQIVRTAVSYAVFSDASNASRAPDGVLLRALHLLSLALDICHAHRESGEHSCSKGDVIPILALACEEISVSKFGDQSLLSLLVLLMRKHKKGNDFVEVGSLNLLFLIESLLKKFAELQPECMKKLQNLAPEVVNQLSQSFPSGDTDSFRSFSDSDKRKAKARERQAAMLEKMKAQQSKFLANIDSTADVAADDSKHGKELCDSDGRPRSEEATPVICSLCHDPNSRSPVSYLILLQKSRLFSLTNRGPSSWEQTRRSGKEPMSERSNLSRSSEIISSSWLMQLIQNKVNEFALEGQPKEVEAFLEYIKEKFPSVKNIQPPCASSTVKKKTFSSFEMLEERMYSLVREEMDANSWHWDLLNNDKKLSALGDTGRAESLMLGRYISALSRECSPSASMHSDKAELESSLPLPAYNGFGPSDCDGIYLSSCGHAVHQRCLDRYLSSLKERYSRRIVFEGGDIVDPDQGEFLCPVCRGLANSVLPALPADTKRSTPSVSTGPSDAVDLSALRFQEALFLLQSAMDVAGSREILHSFPLQQFGQKRVNLESVVQVLCGMYFRDKDKISESGRLSHSLILFDTLKYSLISTEIAARSGKTSLAPNYSLGGLYKELKSSNCFILALLLSIVQSTRTNSSLTVLLRLRGIQLFAESICSDTSVDESPDSPTVGGNMQNILEFSERELQYPDIQFWKRASGPILAHDAFSSLMWVLYCLPRPFYVCEESFLSLVHLFYVVTITQTVITYCRKRQTSLTESGCSDSLVTDIYRIMEEYGVAYKYFDSNHIETHDVKDAIRSLSFPYLRRCALLWKLVRSSISVPFSGGSNVLDGLPYSMGETMECGDNIAVEFDEIEKLEKLFKIPPLDDVISDNIVRFVVPRWLHHFSKQFEARSVKGIMYSTPAVPFKLMLLPHLYQDLFQRYFKQHCPDCGVVLREPALCLLCGRLCSNWKCCRGSGCQTHAMVCGAGTGVFLLIRKTTVLLQRSARQAQWPSPYLDTFGEEDTDMLRGKPLYLNEERYAALTHMVASHGLDRSPTVLHQTNIGNFLML
ncbi:E3 ubiquitin-protein ligase PRT6-like isoform X1 [Lycium ferocissimum]|uniref:E3 ubiquitin-protein ligase PRT6-like isoform X1 n=1 Tax=Lycium ferocissimum TaxID=112874 RepID=UPI002814F95D|nr:E3 ubiquitin-protein ligase PRT6-like isoform X1 [Lycium ferocissimum]XP_059296406.1 E3 ubiquitin-protein ligase PRT6-like isoform X1 [Lycium ferocissimum]XP_059296407.1 E3 ubiquitin-protein ligase PRT6-like isoform X1 [Lycium ferocissimum]XP_059296408.1 E3 ubiquitin-protein ligase PRT6-like isoform X1 [Lycium ferocissimum]